MSKRGPILVIEDDEDDVQIFQDIISELEYPNKLIFLGTTDEGIRYLNETSESVFIIFCDINLPGKNGLEFKKGIDSDPYLRKKSIPFVFYSTSANQADINEAYTQMTVQGFFRKGNEYNEMKRLIKLILDYWAACKHPNTQ